MEMWGRLVCELELVVVRDLDNTSYPLTNIPLWVFKVMWVLTYEDGYLANSWMNGVE